MRMVYWKVSSTRTVEGIGGVDKTLEGLAEGETILLRGELDEVQRTITSVTKQETPKGIYIGLRFAPLPDDTEAHL